MELIFLNKFVIIDLETTGNSPNKGDRIIEIGLVIYENGEIVDKYSQLINPERHISRFISYLTGITNEMVSDQPVFSEVAQQVRQYFDNGYFVAHNVPFDLGFLNYELKQAGLPQVTQPVIDTVELSRILFPQAPSFKLGHLSDWLEIQHAEPHRALSDAYVTTKLLSHLLTKLSNLPLTTLKHLLNLSPHLKSKLSSILTKEVERAKSSSELNQECHYAYNLSFKSIEEEQNNHKNDVPSFGVYLDRLFSESKQLAKTIPDYEDRPGQREMAESIYHAFLSKQHGLIEVDSGAGKTLAYLIAASYYAIKHNERVLVSTYLIQLQDQLYNQEWQQIKEALPFNCDVAVLKGRSHYLNLAKFSQALEETSDNYDQVLTKALLLVWLTETDTGDIDEIQLPSSGTRLFKRISAQTQIKSIVDHDQYQNYYYQHAREKAKKAQLLIINHSILADAIHQEQEWIYSFNQMVIDEAHHLEHTIANRFGLKIDYSSFHKKLKAVNYYFDSLTLNQQKIKSEKLILSALEENELLFNYIYHLKHSRTKHTGSKNDLGRLQHLIEENDLDDWLIANEMAERLQFTLNDLIHFLNQLRVNHYDQTKQAYFIDELTKMKQALLDIFKENPVESSVSWIETERLGTEKSVYLYQQPVDVNKQIKQLLINRFDSIIFTSATLTVAGQFTFIKEQLGIDEIDLIEHKMTSPYVLQDQVKLLIPNDFPIARYDDMDPFIEATCELIFSMVELTSGRTLVLFNSYDMLRKSYYLLREILDDQYMIFAQGITSGSHERLKKNFQIFDQSILLGTNTFWEGLDIPGEDLSVVVMVRLPFDSPNHPIIKQKHNWLINHNQNPFLTFSLPKAVIRFKQGIGRLIRSQSDRGLIIVCDDRLLTKSYGQTFLDSVPDMPIYHRRTSELLDLINHSDMIKKD